MKHKKIATLILTSILVLALTVNAYAINLTALPSVIKGMSKADYTSAIDITKIKQVYPKVLTTSAVTVSGFALNIEGRQLTQSEVQITKTVVQNTDTKDIQLIKVDLAKKYKYEEIEKYIITLGNSTITALEVIGKSVKGKNIYSLSIGSGKKLVLLSAGVHSRETSNTSYMLKFSSELIQAALLNKTFYNKNAKELLSKYTFHIVICASPDGYDLVQFGENKYSTTKSNINLVDLNRNFPSYSAGLLWPGKSKTTYLNLKPSMYYFPGYSLGSEPETQAMMRWMQKYMNKDTHVYIDFHSGGSLVYDYKPEMSTARNANSLKAGAIYSKTSGYKRATDETTGEASDGTTTDYAYSLSYGFTYNEQIGRLTPNSTQLISKLVSTPKYNFPILSIETLKRGLSTSPILSSKLAVNGGHPTTADQKAEWERAKIPQSILATLAFDAK